MFCLDSFDYFQMLNLLTKKHCFMWYWKNNLLCKHIICGQTKPSLQIGHILINTLFQMFNNFKFCLLFEGIISYIPPTELLYFSVAQFLHLSFQARALVVLFFHLSKHSPVSKKTSLLNLVMWIQLLGKATYLFTREENFWSKLKRYMWIDTKRIRNTVINIGIVCWAKIISITNVLC